MSADYTESLGIIKRQAPTAHDLESVLIQFGEQLQRQTGQPEIPTGIRVIDEKCFGLHAGNILLLAARPGSGKTSAMLQMGFHVAKQGKKVCIVSLEMSVQQVIGRLVAIEENIDLFALQRTPGSQISERVWDKIAKFGNTLAQIPKDKFHVVDDYGFTGEEINRLLEYFYIKKPDVILIDHIQHIQFENRKVQEAIDNYMLILKEFAKKNHTSIVVLSQINREGAEEPTMGHLKSSGKLEEISDTVILIHNDTTKTEENNCKFIIAKQRFGPVGVGHCYFSGHETKFYNDYEEYKIKLAARQKTVNIAKDFKTYIARANKDPLDALVERDAEI